MAWGQKQVEIKRKEFIELYQTGAQTFAALCRQFDISRKNGYKWVKRFAEKGIAGLKDRNRAPATQARATTRTVVNKIVELRLKFNTWGPKKILGYLRLNHPHLALPSTTTIGNILDKNGLTVARKYRRRVPPRTEPLAHCQNVNDVWCADFKGWFKTENGEKCEPFTLTDACSRYLIRCVKLDLCNGECVWGVLDAAFREYGLPLHLRTDNGPPFATCGPGRLSKLAVKLIKVGVKPDWIDPGNPQQNGRHERMHLTLKNETANPPQKTLELQSIRLHEFQNHYNFVRPHEALGQRTPGSVYAVSPRVWDGKLRAPEYEETMEKRKVMKCGCVGWKGNNLFISEVLYKEYVGLSKQEDGTFQVYYGPLSLGIIDKHNMFHVPQRKTRRVRKRK